MSSSPLRRVTATRIFFPSRHTVSCTTSPSLQSSNRASRPATSSLLNTPDRITDLSLQEGEWFGVAAKAARVPVAWICLFRPSDLGPCPIDYQIGKTIDGEWTSVLAKSLISNPSTSVAAARGNLASSRALFEALDGGILEPSYFIHSSRSAEAKSRWLAKLASIDYS